MRVHFWLNLAPRTIAILEINVQYLSSVGILGHLSTLDFFFHFSSEQRVYLLCAKIGAQIIIFKLVSKNWQRTKGGSPTKWKISKHLAKSVTLNNTDIQEGRKPSGDE